MNEFARLKEIVLHVANLSESERKAYLDEACPSPELRQKVEAMLARDPGDKESVVVEGTTLDPTTDALPTEIENERIGPYRLIEKVGEGGMGVVYLAEQQEPVRRRVALKVIKRGMDTESVIARFEAERQALALMDHPNIAKVFAAGSTPRGRPYFVMEYVKGIPINHYCDKHTLTTQERLELLIQVCDGVQHAHQKAIIHRDLKPSNLLVSVQGEKAVPKIIDFGVAKATTQKLTEKTVYTALGELIGTPEYMSPEQAEMTGEDIDTRTDVYSLGVILYELLTGLLPFEPAELRKGGFEGIVRTIREQDPPRPSTKVTTLGEGATKVASARRTTPERLRNQLRGDLDWITTRALEKARTRRYGSASEFSADLRRHLKHEPVLARPPSVKYQASRFVRRHRVGVGFAAVLAVLLSAFAVAMAVQTHRIAHERDRANKEAERANEEAHVAQEVTDFLVGLFDVSDPRARPTEGATFRDIMDLGAARIEEGEVGQAPMLQARLLGTMGRVYQNQGLYERAGELLEMELAVRRREQGNKHPDVARALGRLGWLRGAYQRNLADARLHLLEAVAINEEVHGPRHIETAWSLYYLGSALSFCQDPCGIDYLERARISFEDKLGANSIAVSWCWNDLGNSFWDAGDYDRALECNQRAAEIKALLLEPDDPDLAISRYYVGSLLVKLGRCDEAKPVLDEALQSVVKTLGWNHDHTGHCLTSLVALNRCLGDYKEAKRYAVRSEQILAATVGKDSDMYCAAFNELALVALETGQDSKADSLFGKPYETIERVVGRDSPRMAFFLEDRAGSLQRVGRESEATALEERVQAIRAQWWQRKEKCSER